MKKPTTKNAFILTGVLVLTIIVCATWFNSKQTHAQIMGEVFKSNEEFAQLAQKYMSAGNTRASVEDMLLNKGNGKIYIDEHINFTAPEWTQGYGRYFANELKSKNVTHAVHYTFPASAAFGFNWNISFYYDEANKLQQINAGNLLVFPQPHYASNDKENYP